MSLNRTKTNFSFSHTKSIQSDSNNGQDEDERESFQGRIWQVDFDLLSKKKKAKKNSEKEINFSANGVK